MNRIAHLAALGLVLAFTFHGCNGCGKDDQDEGDDTEDNTGDDTEDNTDGKKKDGKKKDGKKKDGKKKGGKEEDTFFQATLYTNEYEGSEGLIKMIAVIGNTYKKRCKINIINVPMKLATVWSATSIPVGKIGHEKKTKKEQQTEDLKKLEEWRGNHECSQDNKSSCKIEEADLQYGLNGAPWYFKKGGSLPMLKIEKNKEDEKENTENEESKKNEIRMFGVNSIETTLATKCLGSPDPDDDESYFDMELRETYHSIIDPLMKIALYERGTDNSLINQLHNGLKSKAIAKLKRLDGIIEELKLYEKENVKFTLGALAVLQLFGSTCPDVDEYFDLFKEMDAVAVSRKYKIRIDELKGARHMQQFVYPTKFVAGPDGTDRESEMEKRRELNYLVKYFRSIQRKILGEKDGTQTEEVEESREEKSVRKALENYLDSPLSLLHETSWENVYTHHPYATVKDKEVLTEKLEKEYTPKHARFRACRVKKPVRGVAIPSPPEFGTMDWIGNVENVVPHANAQNEADPASLFHDPENFVAPAEYPTKGANDHGFNEKDKPTVFRRFCPNPPIAALPKKFPGQCKKLEDIAEKEEKEHPFRGYTRAALRIELGNYQGQYQAAGGNPFRWDSIQLRREPIGTDATEAAWDTFRTKIGVHNWAQSGHDPVDNFDTMREYWFFNKWKMTMRLRDWLQIIHPAADHWFKTITDRHKILVLLYMSKQLIQEKGNLLEASKHAKKRYVAVKQYEDTFNQIIGTNVDYMILRALYVKWDPTKKEEDTPSKFLNKSFELIYGYPEPEEKEPEKKSDHFLEKDDDEFFDSPMPLHLSMDS